jgi:hypothetical protein
MIELEKVSLEELTGQVKLIDLAKEEVESTKEVKLIDLDEKDIKPMKEENTDSTISLNAPGEPIEGKVTPFEDLEVAGHYLSKKGRIVRIKSIKTDERRVIVVAIETGNDIELPADYPLVPYSGTVKKSYYRKKGGGRKKSGETKTGFIDELLQTDLTIEEVIEKALEKYPDDNKSKMKRLVYTRRSRLKKANGLKGKSK